MVGGEGKECGEVDEVRGSGVEEVVGEAHHLLLLCGVVYCLGDAGALVW